MNARIACSTVALLAVAASGCSSMPFGATEEPALIAQSQPKRAGNNVNIASVTLAEPGYIVVHADANGRPGPVIGHTVLMEAGTRTNVNVSIDASRAGERVHPMLHVDDGDGVYQFPGADGPVLVAGSPLVVAVDWL